MQFLVLHNSFVSRPLPDDCTSLSLAFSPFFFSYHLLFNFFFLYLLPFILQFSPPPLIYHYFSAIFFLFLCHKRKSNNWISVLILWRKLQLCSLLLFIQWNILFLMKPDEKCKRQAIQRREKKSIERIQWEYYESALTILVCKRGFDLTNDFSISRSWTMSAVPLIMA